MVIEIDFHPDALPRAVCAFRVSPTPSESDADGASGEEQILAEVPVVDGIAQYVGLAPATGVLGLRWEWD